MLRQLPTSCGRRGAANSEKPDAWGAASYGASLGHNRATLHKSYSLSYSRIVGVGSSILPLPKASTAASGTVEGVHPMGTFCPRCEASALTVRGASAPRQIESAML